MLEIELAVVGALQRLGDEGGRPGAVETGMVEDRVRRIGHGNHLGRGERNSGEICGT